MSSTHTQCNWTPTNLLPVLLVLIIGAVWLFSYQCPYQCPCDAKPSHSHEQFGALQSLYSNDGIQDAYLTVEGDGSIYDPYKYWRGVPWNLPTRNLDRIAFYPFSFEHQIDRYGKMYPYW